MTSQRPFLELTLGEWLDELARPERVPGAGSALAVAAAMAASVLAMAARLSKDGGLAAQAEALRVRTLPLAQVDAEVYAAALEVRERMAGLKPEQRDWEIGRAFSDAAAAPLEIARAGADIAELAAQLASSGDPEVEADARAAAVLAAAAARGAAGLVAVNLTAVEGDPRVKDVEKLAAAAERWASRID